MTEDELQKIKKHIEIHARRELGAIKITQILWKAVEELEAAKKLQEENAELKEKLKPENCLKLLAKEGYIKFTSDQLTKAKEIIKDLLSLCEGENDSKLVFTRAEQFLNSEVEK